MSGREYNKQVEKRQRIKKTTLIIGLDIGSEFNAMGLMNKAGEVIGRYPKIYNSRRGFEYFKTEIEKVKKQKGLKRVLIGMEPTGHYWRKIAYYAQEQGYEVRFVRTTALKHQREVDESSSAKSDIRDAITISNIVREGKYIDTVIKDDEYRQLRTLSKLREKVVRSSTSAQHRLGAVLDDYFPELKEIFWSMKAKGLWRLLEKYPYPRDVEKARIEDIEKVVMGQGLKKKARVIAERIKESAKESIGLKYIGVGDEYRLKIILEEVEEREKAVKGIEKEMKKLLDKIPGAEIIQSIKGVGIITTAILLGELGDPSNFRGAKQIIKYAGYDPKEDDSGKRVGRKIISKKGRWLLRKNLFFIGIRIVYRNRFFKDYYEMKLKTRNKYGENLMKKEALCAVIIKFIKVMFALLRDKRKFSEERPVLMAV